jgi:hypothetical protein
VKNKKPQIKEHARLPIVYDPISRRMFLRGFGAGLAIPFLPSLLNRAEAQTSSSQRFVFTQATHGRWPGNWYPNGAPMTDVGTNVRSTKLSSLQNLGATFGNDFDDIKAKMNIVQGIDYMCASGHDNVPYSAGLLLHYKDGDPRNFTPLNPYTIDTVLAKSSKVYPTPPKIPVLRLNPLIGGNSWSIDGLDSNGFANYLPAYGSTLTDTFNYLQGSISAGSAPAGQASANRRSFLIDRVLGQFKSVTNSTQVSTQDKVSLQNFVDHLTDVQRDRASSASAPALACSLPSAQETTDDKIFNQRLIDMMVIALACGATKIATYNFNWEHCASLSGGVDFHGDTGVHQCGSGAGYDNVLKWTKSFVSYYGYMVRQMQAHGILDDSVVVFMNDMGSSRPNHHGSDLPILTAGSLGGKLRTGELISFFNKGKLLGDLGGTIASIDGTQADGSYQIYGGRRLNELFISLFRAAGMTSSEYQRDGRAGFGTPFCSDLLGPMTCGNIDSDTHVSAATALYYQNDYKESLDTTLPYLYLG